MIKITKKSGQSRQIHKEPLSVRQFPIKKRELKLAPLANCANGRRSHATCEKPGVNPATDLKVGQPPPYASPPEGAGEAPLLGDGDKMMLRNITSLLVLLALLTITGCGAMSATSLRCGTDDDTSYVEVVSAPQSLSQNTRALAELCSFAYQGDSNET